MVLRNRAKRPPIALRSPPQASISPGASLPLVQLAVLLILVRLVNSFSISTYFQPDEYYQALEIAHHYVFGYGYVTWEWREHLRSAIHPLIYAAGYKVMSLINEDWIQISPKVIGAVIAAIGDLAMYRFIQVYSKSEKLARIGLALWILNPFNWYVLTRAFSNSFETVLTILAWVYWPWDGAHVNTTSYVLALAFAVVSCIVRPTNAILWSFLGVSLLFRAPKPGKLLVITTVELVCVLVANFMVDYLFYGMSTFPLYNFLEFNVMRNLSVFYGVAPWHFYLFQGIPLMMMLYLPFTLVALVQNYRDPLVHAGVAVLVGFSLIDHKEFRFIYPLQPLMVLQCSYAVKSALDSWSKRKARLVGGAILIAHVAIAIFFTRINERGVLDLVEYMKAAPEVRTVGFLTPCHSTPWQSYLHDGRFDDSWFLTCEPPLDVPIAGYRDESDQFYDDPIGFLDAMPEARWPSHLVIFEALQNEIDQVLRRQGYVEEKRFFNSVFHWDGRRTGDVIVYHRNSD